MIINIDGDKTLGEEHPGMKISVEAAADILLPREDTHKFIKDDDFEIISNTMGVINISGEEGVQVIPNSTATMNTKGDSVKIEYQGNNTYFMWGIVCIAIIAGAAALLYGSSDDPYNILVNYLTE